MNNKEEFLSKSQRSKCWLSRDKYWECLKANNEKVENCKDLRNVYESSCPIQWVLLLISDNDEVKVYLMKPGLRHFETQGQKYVAPMLRARGNLVVGVLVVFSISGLNSFE